MRYTAGALGILFGVTTAALGVPVNSYQFWVLFCLVCAAFFCGERMSWKKYKTQGREK